MTDEQIMKALECCTNCICNHAKTDTECPLVKMDFCKNYLMKESLSLINRQKAEIEELQKALATSKDEPNGITLKYNEETGEWEKYEPYMTIDCMTEEDFDFFQTAIAKQTLKKPFKESLADYGCASCGAYINFDALNEEIEDAPKYCSECGQKLDWSECDG